MSWILYTNLLLALIISNPIKVASKLDFIFDRVEPIPGDTTTSIDFTDFKVIRARNNHYISGNIEIEDVDDTYLASITIQYSRTGNNQFIVSPMKVPKTPACQFFNSTYKKYIMKSLEDGHSNIPVIPPEGLCPIPKGKYFLKDVDFDSSALPPSMPTGLWKVDLVFYHDNEVSGGVRIYARVSK